MVKKKKATKTNKPDRRLVVAVGVALFIGVIVGACLVWNVQRASAPVLIQEDGILDGQVITPPRDDTDGESTLHGDEFIQQPDGTNEVRSGETIQQ